MATITVSIPSIVGESNIADHEEQIEAIALRDAIETASVNSKHSDIELVRYRDRASPKLAVACASGMNLGEIVITLFRSAQGLRPYMTYTLSQTFVSRIEHDTLDDNGVALQPHFAGSNVTSPTSSVGIGSVVAVLARSRSSGPLVPRSITGIPRGAETNKNIERVWFNASQVRWTYTPYSSNGVASGMIERAWNIQQGSEV